MNFVSFPSIEGFHNVVKFTKSYPYHATRPITYRGKIKLHGCFSAKTLITLADGSQLPINKLKVGDNVLSYDIEKCQYVSKEISNVYEDYLDKDWIELEFDNGTKIKCTKDHLIFTKNRGWVEAQNLDEADIFVEY
jgi:hypothetical protein